MFLCLIISSRLVEISRVFKETQPWAVQTWKSSNVNTVHFLCYNEPETVLKTSVPYYRAGNEAVDYTH